MPRRLRAAGGDAPKQIVLAWTIEDFIAVKAGRRDLGERPTLEAIRVPRAAMWLREGDSEDLEKARAYAAKETMEISVFVYPVDEPEPLERARWEVMARRARIDRIK